MERQGVLPAALITPRNRNEITVFAAFLDTVPPVRGKAAGRAAVPPSSTRTKHTMSPSRDVQRRTRGIQARIARRGIDSSVRLGRPRWVIERTFAQLNQTRHLAVRYERCADTCDAFLTLGFTLSAAESVQSHAAANTPRH